MARFLAYVCVGLALLGAVACGVNEPLRVKTIQVGRSLNSDESVGTHTTRFKPDDTFYVSVITEGAGAGVIVARWFYAGQSLGETMREVSYRRSAATEFHFRNSGGFPAGSYRVEILVDGESVGSRDFRVES